MGTPRSCRGVGRAVRSSHDRQVAGPLAAHPVDRRCHDRVSQGHDERKFPMGLRKNKSLLDQASGTVSEYVEQVRPQLEAAVATAREKAGPALADARTKAAPVIADAKAKAAPIIADAREKAAPAIAAGAAVAAEKIATGATLAAERAAAAAEAAADKVAEVAEPPKKKHRLRKVVIITGVAAGAAYVASRLRGGQESDAWQSSYTPTPAPRPAPTPAPAHKAEQDEGGASPTEAIADQAEAPHPVTTPDDPAT